MDNRKKNLKLCRITTVPISLRILMDGQLVEMGKRGFDVTALSSPGEWMEQIEKDWGLRTLSIPMSRHISPLRDLISLWGLYKIFLRERFDIVHTQTPKAGLLGMLAACAAKVPLRVHTFSGTASDENSNFKWKIVSYTDRITALAANRCLAVSNSLRDLLTRRRTCDQEKLQVLLNGSSNGVDLERFTRTPDVEQRGGKIRKELGIPENDYIILFIGRVVKDKGITELVKAFQLLDQQNTHLVIVGPREDSIDPVPDGILSEIESNSHIHETGFQSDVEAYLVCCTLLVLPSYREGFPNTPLQASAMEKPVISTKITGVVDAVKDGVTGLLVPASDHVSLAEKIKMLLADENLRNRLGKSGREWVEGNFKREKIWDELERVYRNGFSSYN